MQKSTLPDGPRPPGWPHGHGQAPALSVLLQAVSGVGCLSRLEQVGPGALHSQIRGASGLASHPVVVANHLGHLLPLVILAKFCHRVVVLYRMCNDISAKWLVEWEKAGLRSLPLVWALPILVDGLWLLAHPPICTTEDVRR